MDSPLFDLGVLAKKLRKRSECRKFVDLVAQTLDAMALLRDIKLCKQFLDQLKYVNLYVELNATAPEDELNPHLIGNSLFGQALITYCRATDTTGGRKGRGIPAGTYNADDLEKHRELVRLRNQVYAHHVHKKTDSDGQWLRQTLTIHIRGGKKVFRDYHQSFNWRADRVNDLIHLVEILLPCTETQKNILLRDLETEMDRLASVYPDTHAVFESCLFDGLDFAQDPSSAEKLMDRSPGNFANHLYSEDGAIRFGETDED